MEMLTNTTLGSRSHISYKNLFSKNEANSQQLLKKSVSIYCRNLVVQTNFSLRNIKTVAHDVGIRHH